MATMAKFIILSFACATFVAVTMRASPRWARTRTTAGHKISSVDMDPGTSCGPASLAVVSEYLGRPATISDFHEKTGAGNLGACSFDDLVRALTGHGLSAVAVRYEVSRPPRHRLPLILFVDGDHFLSALPGARGTVVIVDPPHLPWKTSWTDLSARWRGEAVVVARNPSELDSALNADGGL